MTHQIEIQIRFRAGHRLMPPYVGHCNNVHGEGFTAICIFENELNPDGMVIDFSKVKKQVKEWIDANLDHTYIHHQHDPVGVWLKKQGHRTYNLVINPTSENLAAHLYKIIRCTLKLPIKKVGIVESFEDSIAWFEGTNQNFDNELEVL